MNAKKILSTVLSFISTILVVLVAIKLVKHKVQDIKNTPTPEKIPPVVEVVRVKKGSLSLKEHFIGKAEAIEKTRLSTKIMGTILDITKEVGDAVKKGEIIARIDARDIKFKISSLKSQLWAAEQELTTRKSIFDRNKILFKYKIISKEAFDLSKTSYELAKSRVKQLKSEIASLKSTLSYSVIRAPFSGIVSQKFKNKGEVAVPGTPILELENPEKGYKILINVPQNVLKYIKENKTEVLINADGQNIKAYVSKIYPRTSANALPVVEVRVKGNSLISGAIVGADIVMKKPYGFIIPLQSIVPTTSTVFVLNPDNTLKKVKVEILGTSEDLAVCQADLREGDRVVVGDPGLLIRLHEGQRVRLAHNEGQI